MIRLIDIGAYEDYLLPHRPDMIYIDPPFFTGRDFVKFSDRYTPAQYENFLGTIITKSYDILNFNGNFLLHLDWHAAHIARSIGDEIFGRDGFHDEIIWSYNSGGASKRRLAKKHDTILRWSKGSDFVFNIEREPYPNDYGDRAGFHPDGRMLTDVWSIPRLSSTAKDRSGWPTEKPPALLDRLVDIYSNPGQLVLDPMCGGGTTLLSAHKLGRAYIGLDISPDAVTLTKQRIKCLI